jgi:putative transposase
LAPKKHEDFEHDVKLDVEARVRQGVKTVLEEVLEEEMTQHLGAGYRELTPTRQRARNGYYQRNLVTPAGKIERLEVPRDREGEFVTELFERYKRMSGDVEEAVLEMYLSGISVRKIAGVRRRHGRLEQGEDRQGRREPHRFSAPRAAERVEGALSGGEGIPLPLPGCHLLEGPLGS